MIFLDPKSIFAIILFWLLVLIDVEDWFFSEILHPISKFSMCHVYHKQFQLPSESDCREKIVFLLSFHFKSIFVWPRNTRDTFELWKLFDFDTAFSIWLISSTMTNCIQADDDYCLLPSEFSGFLVMKSLNPLRCVYHIQKYFVTTDLLKSVVTKKVSIHIRGFFQAFSPRVTKSVDISEVIRASTSRINIGSILIEKPVFDDTSVYLIGIVSTLSKTDGRYNIAFNDGTVSYCRSSCSAAIHIIFVVIVFGLFLTLPLLIRFIGICQSKISYEISCASPCPRTCLSKLCCLLLASSFKVH